MKKITLRVLDGADKGKTFEEIQVPVTIGREEGNTIQLNDERVSRYHLKIQQDHDDLVLTDLESTNGSKINNEEVQLRILRHGDLISVGRSTLILGNRSEINQRRNPQSSSDIPETSSQFREGVVMDENWQEENSSQSIAIVDREQPRLPERLSPGQAAQLSELIEFLHVHFRDAVAGARIDSKKRDVRLSKEHWQQLLEVQSHLAEYLHKISNP